jgi:hypothetical protein
LGTCFVGIVIVFNDGKAKLIDGKHYPNHDQYFLELDLKHSQIIGTRGSWSESA